MRIAPVSWRALPVALLVALLTLGVTACAPKPVAATTSIFLVRHGEKAMDAENPALTPAGRARALSLAQTLRSVALDAVYSTDTARTRQTATPTAEAQGLPVRIYDKDELVRLSLQLRQTPGRYLIVGHSNTTPELVAKLGGEPGAAIDEIGEFDRLYVIVLHPDGSVETLLLRYGDAAP